MKFVLMGFATILGLGLGIFVIWTSFKDKSSKYAFGGPSMPSWEDMKRRITATARPLNSIRATLTPCTSGAPDTPAAREFPQAVSCYERCLRLEMKRLPRGLRGRSQ